jgi:hypothetical protein
LKKEKFRSCREQSQRARLFYEVFPIVKDSIAEPGFTWLEIALHAEAKGRSTGDRAADQRMKNQLLRLANFLVRTSRPDAFLTYDLSAQYYSLLPPALDQPISQARVFRSLSLTFLGLAPYMQPDRLKWLAELEERLSSHQVSRIKIAEA